MALLGWGTTHRVRRGAPCRPDLLIPFQGEQTQSCKQVGSGENYMWEKQEKHLEKFLRVEGRAL